MKKTKNVSFGVCVKAVLLCALVRLVCTSCANFNEYKRRVAVTVTDGIAKPIELVEHKNDRGKAAGAVVPLIVEKQTLQVDSISGATNSSLVIKKAIQNALESAAN